MEKYGGVAPPEFNLTQLSLNIANVKGLFILGEYDAVVTPIEVEKLQAVVGFE